MGCTHLESTLKINIIDVKNSSFVCNLILKSGFPKVLAYLREDASIAVNLALLVFTLSWTQSREGHEDQQSESRDKVERWGQRAGTRGFKTLLILLLA